MGTVRDVSNSGARWLDTQRLSYTTVYATTRFSNYPAPRQLPFNPVFDSTLLVTTQSTNSYQNSVPRNYNTLVQAS